MLKLFSKKINNKIKKLFFKKDIININQVKHFPLAIKEWDNGIYTYNKNTLSLIPITSKIVIKLIKSYFNLYNINLESKIKRHRLRIKIRILSSHKIYVSKGEFKHTNNKVIINIYIYNRQRYNYLYKIKKRYKEILKEKNLLNKIKKIRKKAFLLINKTRNNKFILINNFKWINKYKYYENYYYKNYIIKNIKREMLYLYYRKLLLINKFKFKYTYLKKIMDLISKIYNKNVEFNIVNLKYYYLHSDILTESILTKITKNRKKLHRILKTSIQKVKIKDKKWMQNFENIHILNKLSIIRFIKASNMQYNLYNNFNKKSDQINDLLNNIFSKHLIKSKKTLQNIVLNLIKNKIITGIRVEAKGRLTKRHTAERSLYRLRYKGSLRNKDSFYNNISSLLLRGNKKSNLQYTKLNSIVKIGSYGIKGWVSNN